MINTRTNRHIVIDPAGNILEIPRDPKAPGYAKYEDQPKLKDGWRSASEADLKAASDAESKRSAKEKTDAAAAEKAARAAQDKADAAARAVGGPAKAKE